MVAIRHGRWRVGQVLAAPIFVSAIALSFRLLLVQRLLAQQSAFDLLSSGGEMVSVAASLAHGDGFGSPWNVQSGPTAVVPPVYPLLLSGAFRIFGVHSTPSAWMILTLNSLFSASICTLLYSLGTSVFGRGVGIAAAWMWAFFPFALEASTRVIWESSLSAFLLTLILLTSLRLMSDNRVWAWLGYGAIWGTAILTNTSFIALLPLIVGWLWFRVERRIRRLVGIATITTVAIMSLWVIRNYVVFRQFVFIRSNLGLELQLGNNPSAKGESTFWLHPGRNQRELQKYLQMGELAYMAEKKEEAVSFIQRNRSRFLRLIFRRAINFWTGTFDLRSQFWLPGSSWEKRATLSRILVVLAFTGLCLALLTKSGGVIIFAFVLAGFPLAYYFAHPRSRHPVEPVMVLLIVYTVSVLVKPLIRGAGQLKRLPSKWRPA